MEAGWQWAGLQSRPRPLPDSERTLIGRVVSDGPSLTALWSKGQSTELLPIPDTGQGPGSTFPVQQLDFAQ